MLATKLACPFCQSVLKTRKPVPDGTRLTCPKCARAFVVGAGPLAFQAGPPPRPITTNQVTAQPPPPPRPLPLPSAHAPDPAIALPSSSARKRLTLVLGGLFLLAVLGGTLLALFMRGNDAPEDEKVAGKLILPAAGSTPKAKAKPLIELTPDEEKKVKEMTDKGVDWLRKNQKPDGTWAPYNGHLGSWPDGVTAMAGLTLLSCGVEASDSAVQKAAERIRAAGPKLNRTYEVALCILFLDKLGEAKDAKLLEMLTFHLLCGQNAMGGWHYHCPIHSEKDQQAAWQALHQLEGQRVSLLQESVSATQESETQKAMKDLPVHIKRIGAFSKPPEKGGDFWRTGGDNSNTQFAVLALWAAKKHKLPVARPLQLAVRRFKESQNSNGSWNYSGRTSVIPQPTMTCAGLLALAVEYGVRDEKDLKGTRPEDNPSIKNALEHVAGSLSSPKDKKAKTPYPPLYFVWSVERVGMLFQLKNIAGVDWYRWGMRILDDHQLPDGHWHQGWHASNDVVDTCFALLFLNRVNLTADLTDKLSEFGLADAPMLGMAPAKE